VNWYKGKNGDDRLWFDQAEIEAMAEGELVKASLLPPPENPVVDIERFIEGHLGARLDQHADLDPDVLGVTEFPAGLPPEISINRDLTQVALDREEGAPGTVGRWRATLAHEASHVLLHQVLFDVDPGQGSLLDRGGEPAPPKLMRCLKREVTFGREARDWREVQANRGMAGLLMPKSIFLEVAGWEFDRLGLTIGAPLDPDSSGPLAAVLARRVDVSQQAASIRLETLGLVKSPLQPALEVP